MRKIKSFNGLGALIALAVLAISAITFTSCEKEQFNIKPTHVEAKVTFNVSAILINKDSKIVNITDQVTFANAEPIVGNPTIEAQTRAITATYNGETQEEVINIPALKSNEIAYAVKFMFIEQGSEIKIEVEYEQEGGVEKEEVQVENYVDPAADYWFEGSYWFSNETDLNQEATITYDVNTCELVNNSIRITNPEDYGNIYRLAQSLMTFGETAESTFNIPSKKISRFRVVRTYVFTTYNVSRTITETEITKGSTTELVGSFTMKTLKQVEFQQTTLTHPDYDNDHAGHDQGHDQGHGHGHGDSGNAGGGVIDSE